jgi:poly-gamma-glutamate synthesis protein (capsule biosynthesis protein)
LRGVEWYAGKPIFYGLGHFVLDLRPAWSDARLEATAGLDEADSYDLYERPGWPLLPMHPDSRLTMLGWVEVNGQGEPARAGFLACALTPDGRVHAHDARSETGQAVARYIEQCCAAEELPVVMRVTDDPSFDGLATIAFEPRGA